MDEYVYPTGNHLVWLLFHALISYKMLPKEASHQTVWKDIAYCILTHWRLNMLVSVDAFKHIIRETKVLQGILFYFFKQVPPEFAHCSRIVVCCCYLVPAHLTNNRKGYAPCPTFIKPDQLDPWIKDQIKIILLLTISHLQLPSFVACGRACPSHMTQNLVTVGAKLWTAEHFLDDPWSMDYADLVW